MMKAIIFGTGKMAEDVLASIEMPIAYFVDNDKNRWGRQFHDLPIHPPDVILSEDLSDIFVLIASSFVTEISDQLRQMGLKKGVHFDIYMEGKGGLYDRKTVYSQEGEELILQRLFRYKKTGCYVDVGAHHPIRFSNTYSFYRMGWRGINIDPVPGMKAKFDLFRPGDINLEIGISDQEGLCEYYMFDEPALNTFNPQRAEELINDSRYSLIEVREVPLYRLATVLEQHVAGMEIDFLSVDAEGLDLRVLSSNDWNLFRPEVILVEAMKTDLQDILESPIHAYLTEKGYLIFSKLFHTCIYRRSG